MRPAIRAALLVAVLAAAARLAPRPGADRPRPVPSASAAELTSRCPPRTLPDDGVCIPVPDVDPGSPAELRAQAYRADERLPRRPDRSPAYADYLMPVPPPASASAIHQPPPSLETEGAGPSFRASGLLIEQPPGTEVRVVALERQEGAATVLFSGRYVGETVVTLHRVRERDEARAYVVLLGGLEKAAAETGTELEPAAPVGTVGDTATPGRPGLYLDVRRVRPKVDAGAAPLSQLLDDAHSIPTDPRNVYPPRPRAAAARHVP